MKQSQMYFKRVLAVTVAVYQFSYHLAQAQLTNPVTPPVEKIDSRPAHPLTVTIDKATQRMRICSPEISLNSADGASGSKKVEIDVEAKFGTKSSSWFGSDEITYGPWKHDITSKLVTSADGIRCYETKVSTGGSFKQPSNLVKEAYCSKTEDFEGFVPAGKNMDKAYKSKTFLDQNGNGADMPWAIRFRGGEFLHQANNVTVNDLGEAVSGGCVRMYMVTAQVLFALTIKHKGLQLKISGEEKAPKVPCTVPAAVAEHRLHLKSLCERIGKSVHCYEKDLNEAVAEDKIKKSDMTPPTVLPASQTASSPAIAPAKTATETPVAR
jgi:hypothetical protein